MRKPFAFHRSFARVSAEFIAFWAGRDKLYMCKEIIKSTLVCPMTNITHFLNILDTGIGHV